MAKSLRSKWKRKCRAIKRERYAAKELDRLKKTLGIDENAPKDVEMTNLEKIATGKTLYYRIAENIIVINIKYIHIYRNIIR